VAAARLGTSAGSATAQIVNNRPLQSLLNPAIAAGEADASRRATCARLSMCGLVLVVGCASGPPKPATIAGSVVASPALNLDARQRASPVVLRLYELKSAALFDTADFVSLYDKDQATLSGEMVGREEMVMRPGETRAIASRPLAPETKVIGVMVAFRDLERARWRAVVPVVPARTNLLLIQLDELAVQASVTLR
jgi:type VI secretion system protein VasD